MTSNAAEASRLACSERYIQESCIVYLYKVNEMVSAWLRMPGAAVGWGRKAMQDLADNARQSLFCLCLS